MKDKEILAFAHRGVSKEFPENTMPSFSRAAELKADFIETDIHFTRDRRFAVIHDGSIDRTTNGAGAVTDFTMNELKKFDAGYYFTQDFGVTFPFRDKGISIPSLDELFEAFPYQKINIELKVKNPDQVKYFIDVVGKFDAHKRIIAASEHFSNLKAIRKICPDIETSFSLPEILMIYFLYKSGLFFLNIKYKGIALQIPENRGRLNIVTKPFVKQAHENGIQVHVWTINNEEDMRRLAEIGVDGIMSDDLALLLKVLKR